MLSSLTYNKNKLANFNPAHLVAMTDDTGMFQHCRYSIPDRRHGYTLDDNVRALLAAAQSEDPVISALLPIYLSFVMYCQQPNGLFVNFMSYDRRFLESVGSPDSQGRTLWALGCLYLEKPLYRPLVEPILEAFRWQVVQMTSPRTLAFALLGMSAYLKAQPEHLQTRLAIREMADRLLVYWEKSEQPGWHWFEDYVTYENARFPQAFFEAYLATGVEQYLTVACKAADFLEELHFKAGYLKLIGSDGWLKRGQVAAQFDEQPVEAGALVEMYNLAYEITNERHYLDLASCAFAWYSGRNCHSVPVYDPLTGGVYDGLMVDGLNYNQGAESVLSYVLAWQSLQKSL
jgi:hypothetical protein